MLIERYDIVKQESEGAQSIAKLEIWGYKLHSLASAILTCNILNRKVRQLKNRTIVWTGTIFRIMHFVELTTQLIAALSLQNPIILRKVSTRPKF